MERTDFQHLITPKSLPIYLAICRKMIEQINPNVICITNRHPCDTSKCPFFNTIWCRAGKIKPAAKMFIRLFDNDDKRRSITINKTAFYENEFE